MWRNSPEWYTYYPGSDEMTYLVMNYNISNIIMQLYNCYKHNMNRILSQSRIAFLKLFWWFTPSWPPYLVLLFFRYNYGENMTSEHTSSSKCTNHHTMNAISASCSSTKSIRIWFHRNGNLKTINDAEFFSCDSSIQNCCQSSLYSTITTIIL